MATHMTMAKLDLVDGPGENTQMAAVLEQPYKIRPAYAKIPEPGPDEVRVKIKYTGICGSDLEAYRGTRAPEFISIPARLGHEVGGIIDKIGENVRGLRVGDKVTCRYIWGAFAQYIVCKPFNVKVLPEHFPLKTISPVEVLPGILHAVDLAKLDQTKNVLIMGQGVSGLLMTQAVALSNPKNLVVTDLYDSHLTLAKQYGATHTYKLSAHDAKTADVVKQDFPDGFDIVIPCLLEGDGLVDAIDMAAVCGKIILYGCIGVCNKPIDFFRFHRKRLELYSTEPRRDIDMRHYFHDGIELICDGLIQTDGIITHIVPFSRIQEAFDIRNQAGEDTIHVLVDCEA